MPQYLITIYQPDGPTPGNDAMDRIERELHALNKSLKTADAWVFTGGLQAADRARTLRPERIGTPGAEVLATDGPYVEGKEHVGGLWVITAPDLDAAAAWGRRAAQATTLPVEVREFQDAGAF